MSRLVAARSQVLNKWYTKRKSRLQDIPVSGSHKLDLFSRFFVQMFAVSQCVCSSGQSMINAINHPSSHNLYERLAKLSPFEKQLILLTGEITICSGNPPILGASIFSISESIAQRLAV